MSIIVDTETPVIEASSEESQVMPEAVVEAAAESTEVITEHETIDESLPEKYQGKSIADVIEMHQNVEQALSKQGIDLGKQRATVGSLMEALEQQKVTVETEVDQFSGNEASEEDFYADPAAAVKSAIEQHPEIVRAREERINLEHQHNAESLGAVHPNFKETVKTEEFQNWVEASTFRTELFLKADNQYDVEAAKELFGTWEQIQNVTKTKQASVKSEKSRKDALRQMSSESRTGGESLGGKKVYRRADLINLQVTDPNRYAALADEIQQAYAEGRVK
ncbi:MAG: hypothetical protein ABGY11_10430 [Candidatus Thioglobus sp.]